MEAKELRIGNYIQDNDSKRIGYVLTIGSKKTAVKMKFSKLMQDIEEFEHIPLTEEWLINLGFENKTLDYWGIKIFEKNGFVLDDKFAMMDIDIRVDFKTVHHLQNTFFALTGEELTLKN